MNIFKPTLKDKLKVDHAIKNNVPIAWFDQELEAQAKEIWWKVISMGAISYFWSFNWICWIILILLLFNIVGYIRLVAQYNHYKEYIKYLENIKNGLDDIVQESQEVLNNPDVKAILEDIKAQKK